MFLERRRCGEMVCHRLASLHGLDDLLCGIVEIVGGQHVEARFADNLLAGIDIGAFKPDHQRHFEAGFLHRGDHTLGNDVAFHDAAEDIDQDALHVRIGGNDLERRGDLGLVGAATDIEEVGWRHAVELDDVHRRHRKAGAVDHAADGAVERDVIEVVFRRLDFLGVFLGLIAQRHHFGVAIERVAVERHLGVEHAQIALLGDDQRIDFQHRHVLADEGCVELRYQFFRLFGEIPRQSQRLRHGAAVMRHDAGGGIDREGHDLLGTVVGDVLDIDAAFGGDHEGYFGGFAIDQDRQIKLLVDLGAFLDVEPVDLLAMRPGLDRDQRGTQHLLGEFIDLGDRLGDTHAALVAGGGFLELALAAAAGVNLALHHPDRTAQRFRRHVGVGSPQHRYPARDRHAEFVQQRLGLIFMDVHLDALRTLVRSIWNSHPFLRLAYHTTGTATKTAPEIGNAEDRSVRSSADGQRDQRPSKSGAIFLQASTRPCTAPTDLSNASRSLPASSISTMRSTPFEPITTGTPTYMSLTPYSPFR